MVCPHCYYNNPEGSKFCNECGKPLPLPQKVICSECGCENSVSVEFCECCGVPFKLCPPKPQEKNPQIKPSETISTKTETVVSDVLIPIDEADKKTAHKGKNTKFKKVVFAAVIVFVILVGIGVVEGVIISIQNEQKAPETQSKTNSANTQAVDSSKNHFKISNGVLTKYTGRDSQIIIPDGVTSIGEEAFKERILIKSVTIPDSVTSIGDNAFYDCTGLTSITIPNSVTCVGDLAFSGCNKLTSITIPDSVTEIGDGAFGFCESLTNLAIPKSVTNIGYHAFVCCESINSISVSKENKTYDSRDNCNAIIETSTNQLIVGCSKTVIPNNVTGIGDSAFYDCTGLTSITIPSSVTKIGDNAFYYCTGITSITIPDSVTEIGDDAFGFCESLTSLAIPKSVTNIGYQTFAYCENLNSISVSKENKTYDSRDNCNAIIETSTNQLIAGCNKTVIPNDVTSIGDGAFSGCDELKSITIPDSVTSIGKYAFEDCDELTSITIPKSVTKIGEDAFKWCFNLQSIKVPEGFDISKCGVPNTCEIVRY